jgi:hypothetical protein
MLTNRTIRKLNHALSDKQVARDPMTERDHKNDKGEILWTCHEIFACETAWGHAALLFREPVPASLEGYAQFDDRSEEILTRFLADLEAAEKRQVWPVFVGETAHPRQAEEEHYIPHEGQQLVQFLDRERNETMADGRYVATILKKHRRYIDALRWYVADAGPHAKIIADLAGEIVAAFAPVRHDGVHDWQWNLTNRDLPPEPRPYRWEDKPAALEQPALF